MQNKRNDISEKLLEHGSGVIKLMLKLEKTATGRLIAGQLTRSATSAGANYEEACGAESRADFIHKMQIVLKELKESGYWLRLVERAALLPKEALGELMMNNEGLVRIIAKSVITAKQKNPNG